MKISAHKDFRVVKKFGTVTTRIKTGYKYEEIKKIQIIGELAEQLAKKLNYNEPILLDFDHHYVGVTEPIYYLSFDDGEIKYKYVRTKNKQTILNKKRIVVRQVSSEFDIINTLKMLEYSIRNWATIEKEQKKVERWDCIINSIDTNKSIDILDSKETEVIKEIKNTKIYRHEKSFRSGITYFWQNDKYNIVFVEKGKEKIITSFTRIYDIQKKHDIVFIFETPAEFIVFDTHKKEIVSKKLKIKNAEKNYKPYKINNIEDNKYSISFYYRSKESGIKPKKQILIYAQNEGKLIQMNKLINN